MYKKIAQSVLNDTELQNEFYDTQRSLYRLMQNVVDEFFYSIDLVDDRTVENTCKFFGVKFNEKEYLSLLEKVLDYVDVVSDLAASPLTIFVGMKKYFSVDDLKEIYKHIRHKKINVLFIEQGENDKIENEKKMIIDKNYDDFLDII